MSLFSKRLMAPSRNMMMNKSVILRQFSAIPTDETYTDKMIKKGRPVSPHVTIYRFPVVAISSITNRVTGALLSVGVTGIAALSLGGIDTASTMIFINQYSAAVILKFGVAFPLIYHYLGGIRHMMWDRMPDSLTNNDVQQSSLALMGGATALSAGIAFVNI
jgi:succinate dehydrogenase (ubiquinone) cytochrome b560 subunit